MVNSYEAYLPSSVEAFPYKEAAVEAAVQQQAGHTSEGQQFSGIYVPGQPSSEGSRPAVVHLNAVFADSGNVDQQYVAAQYNGALPNYDYLALDAPGHGNSDGLSQPQRKAINAGDLSLVSKAQVEAALDITPNLDDVVLVGEAVGGLLALSFAVEAARKGISVRGIFDFDPVALEKRTPVKLAASYLFNAQKSRNERKAEADDASEQSLENAFKKFEIEVQEKYGPTKHATKPGHLQKMAKERAILTFMFRKSPFSHATGLAVLQKIMSEHRDTAIHIVFGGRSIVGRPTEGVLDGIDALQASDRARRHGNSLEYDIWPNDNQDLGLARHQPRLVKYVKDHVASS